MSDTFQSTLSLPKQPLKDLDGTMLTLAILEETQRAGVSQPKLQEAISLAAYLHRSDTRKNSTRSTSGKINQPTSPYIVHPLRNTLRIIRWGVTDLPTLIGSILHDTVEDHAQDIVNEFTDFDAAHLSEEEIRRIALGYLTEVFGVQSSWVVEGVSNPLIDDNLPREQKNVIYVAHLNDTLPHNARRFLVKLSDVIDNGFSLHHHTSDPKVADRAAKYLLLLPVLISSWRQGIAHPMLSKDGIRDINYRLDRAERYLRQMSAA